MPILTNQEVGDQKDVTRIVFGTGDVCVQCWSHEDGGPEVVTLYPGIERPESEWNIDVYPDAEYEDLPAPIIQMEFNNPKSIDTVIKMLEKAKELLHEKFKRIATQHPAITL